MQGTAEVGVTDEVTHLLVVLRDPVRVDDNPSLQARVPVHGNGFGSPGPQQLGLSAQGGCSPLVGSSFGKNSLKEGFLIRLASPN